MKTCLPIMGQIAHVAFRGVYSKSVTRVQDGFSVAANRPMPCAESESPGAAPAAKSSRLGLPCSLWELTAEWCHNHGLNQVRSRRTRLVWSLICFWCVTSHPGQLSLLPLAVWELSTGQWALPVLFSREGNRRSGVALAMHHRLGDIYPPTGWVS